MRIPILRPRRSFDLTINASNGTATANDGQSGRPANFTANIQWVRLVATVDCRVNLLGGTATATNTLLLPAGVPEYFEVTGVSQLSVISNTTSTGTLVVSEMGY